MEDRGWPSHLLSSILYPHPVTLSHTRQRCNHDRYAQRRKHARHCQTLPWRARQRPCRFRAAARRDPRAAGRKRRRQEHANEYAGRALPARCRLDRGPWQAGHARLAAPGDSGRHRHDSPALYAGVLSVGEQQRVEILKMLYSGADILILDEPTAVLGSNETEQLFKTLRDMTTHGKSVVFISHKLQEVKAIADRVTVLRRGRVTAADVPASGTSTAELARLMVGRNVLFLVEREPQPAGEVVLGVDDLYAENDRGLPALQGVTLQVRAGEIVGIAGVAGNGQRELAEVITGLRRSTHGQVQLNGENLANQPVRRAIERGLAHVPEDRTHVGSAPGLSLTDNLIMKQYQQAPIGRGWRLDAREAEVCANRLKQTFEIRAPSVDIQARLLSGGNLQRLILAREIAARPKCMVAMQPTQGLDVGAVETVHKLLLEQRKQGVAILLISEELDELLGLSDRIYVMYDGKIVGEVDDGDIDRIAQLMTGSV